MQAELRAALGQHMQQQSMAHLSRQARDEDGDTVFGIDVHAEETLLACCERWGRHQEFVLVAEGLPSAGRNFGKPGHSDGPPFALLVDPIDGTRGLMFDKRSAWSLAGIALLSAAPLSLSAIQLAVQTELPTTRQVTSDVLWAVRGRGAEGRREHLERGTSQPLPLHPSAATDLRHGFATVNNFFPGGKELLASLDEAIMVRALGRWDPAKAEVYADQYICTGGQLAELALGRDRFVLDVRPLAHQKLGVRSSLACRPYDLAASLIAQEAGCLVLDPWGAPLHAPLDTTTNVSFAAYANANLCHVLSPIVRDEVHRLLR